ncbi:MAG TPA: FHA domain-containing protein [Firmicutes bacterium]|nr:FHA domain-containing protein [Bacillota bacterium]
MIEELMWAGRLGLLALLYLFLLRLSYVLSKSISVPKEAYPSQRWSTESGYTRSSAAASAAAVRTTKRTGRRGTAAADYALRLLRSNAAVWVNAADVEHKMEVNEAIDITGDVHIGRAAGNHVRLEDPFTSAYHARLIRRRQSLVIEDLDTTNGTRVNGVRIKKPVRLAPGDMIDIGGASFLLEKTS